MVRVTGYIDDPIGFIHKRRKPCDSQVTHFAKAPAILGSCETTTEASNIILYRLSVAVVRVTDPSLLFFF